MPRHTNLMSLFEDIATQIRAKKGESSSVTYKVDDLDTAVSTITTYKPEETFDVDAPITQDLSVQPSTPGNVFTGGIVRKVPTGSLTPGAGSVTVTPTNWDWSNSNSSGIVITANGSGSVSSSAGYVTSGTTTSNSAELVRYIHDVTVPVTKSLTVTAAGTLTIDNSGLSSIAGFTENKGLVSVNHSTSGEGRVNVSAYGESNYHWVIQNGAWVSTTVTPSSISQGPYYGKITVNGADIINHVSSVPVSKSTDIIYNSNDNNYYIWED